MGIVWRCLFGWERGSPVAYNASFQGLHVGLPLNYLLVLFSVFLFSQTDRQDAEVQQAAHHPYTCVGNGYTPPLDET